ncbi:hypothetical protein [Flavobacterium sp. TAB 87]|uniref:hypothetical protein n=1 Tax=Flavobacterium sp. TAB 87 TaxID=1729581 RepID=UPI00076DCF86|nr:hypothetical protein [Flavobacterium sp. TAB 87]KVV13779.1 hypothetical protein AP058_03148 [Flavobacterium sp. TAB 87]
MNKKDFIIGLFSGIAMALIGTILFITLFTDIPFRESYLAIKSNNHLGKVITLGTILDLILFAFLLKKNKESMAKGVIAAVLLLTFFTLII